jgi:hypothetical protein
MEMFRDVLADASSLSEIAEKANHPPVRQTILEAARKTLEHAMELLPPEVQRKKFIVTNRDKFTPWSEKSDHSTFKREILSFLSGAYKGATASERMKEMHRLWDSHKDAPNVEDAIRAAIQEIKELAGDA